MDRRRNGWRPCSRQLGRHGRAILASRFTQFGAEEAGVFKWRVGVSYGVVWTRVKYGPHTGLCLVEAKAVWGEMDEVVIMQRPIDDLANSEQPRHRKTPSLGTVYCSI